MKDLINIEKINNDNNNEYNSNNKILASIGIQNENKLEFKENHFLSYLTTNEDVAIENERFVLKNKEDDIDYKPLEDAMSQVKCKEVPETNGMAYIIEQNGIKTLYLKNGISKIDFLKIEKSLSAMNIKVDNVIGHEQDVKIYKEYINPNAIMYKNDEPNNKLHGFIVASTLGMAIIMKYKFDQSSFKNMNKIKKLMKKRKLKKSLEFNTDEEDDELELLHKKLSDIDKKYLKMSEENRLKHFKHSIYGMLSHTKLSPKTTDDIVTKLNGNHFDDIINSSLSPKNALVNVIISELNKDRSVEQFVESYNLNPNVLKQVPPSFKYDFY